MIFKGLDAETLQRLADKAVAFGNAYDAEMEAAYEFECRHASLGGAQPRFCLVPTVEGWWGIKRLDGGPDGYLPSSSNFPTSDAQSR